MIIIEDTDIFFFIMNSSFFNISSQHGSLSYFTAFVNNQAVILAV